MKSFLLLFKFIHLVFFLSIDKRFSFGQELNDYCKINPKWPNHQFSLWKSDFPYAGDVDNQPPALCKGTVTLNDDGDICIDGRVTYAQLMDQLEELGISDPIYQPAVRSISVNGQLIGGSSNVVLGSHGTYLHNFVTSYVLNGTEYSANDGLMMDHVLAASRGTIDGICLSANISQPEEYYSISHRLYSLSGLTADDLYEEDLALIFFGYFNAVSEFHKTTSAQNMILETISQTWLSLINLLVSAFPAFFYDKIPVFTVTGMSRLIVRGTYTTKDFPNPFTAAENLGQVEGVQIDVTWETFVRAVTKEGLFTKEGKEVPLYFNAVVKKLIATGGSNFNCWSDETIVMASIDLEAPAGQGGELDTYINDVVFPALSVHSSNITIHFGKRTAPGSPELLQSAIDFYGSCGVEVGLTNITECYHPMCHRTNTVSDFEYPVKYYEF